MDVWLAKVWMQSDGDGSKTALCSVTDLKNDGPSRALLDCYRCKGLIRSRPR
jgi:hypothetical protein